MQYMAVVKVAARWWSGVQAIIHSNWNVLLSELSRWKELSSLGLLYLEKLEL
jgi:hypothetical protein